MTMPTADRFVEYYKAVYGRQSDPKLGPFPWQERVTASVCAGKWPRVIALPTAAGKTACIDIAVFALACHAENAPRHESSSQSIGESSSINRISTRRNWQKHSKMQRQVS